MEDKEILTTEETPDFPAPPVDDFDPEAERERREAEELAPYRAAAQQRKESAAILAEHDELLADMLFEITMKDLEE